MPPDEAPAAEATPDVTKSGTQGPANVLAAWDRAKATVEAAEAKTAPPEPKAKPKPAEAKPAPKAEAKPADPPKPEAKPDEVQDDGDKDDGAPSVPERRKFREEKRKAREAVAAEKRQMTETLSRAEAFYAPHHRAALLLKDGDIDGALRQLAKIADDPDIAEGGLGAANNKHLRREQNKDPRVDRMERELAERRKADAERQQTVAQQQEQAARARAQAEWKQALAEDLKDHPYAGNSIFIEGVFQKQQESYDGYEAMSASEAAEAFTEQLANDKRALELFHVLQSVYGDRAASASEALEAANRDGASSRRGRAIPPKTVGKTVEASPSEPMNGRDVQALIKRFAPKLQESR